jgi:hypothetical protein
MIESATIWQIEEKLEDVVAAYLNAAINDAGIYVGTAFTTAKYKEPGVYVMAEQSENVSEDHGFNGYRAIDVAVIVRTHADPETDASLLSSRGQHGALKSRIARLLAVDELKANLNARTDGTLAVDMCNIEGLQRTIDAENNAFQTVITLNCAARPVET